jgi:hypothetical protein
MSVGGGHCPFGRLNLMPRRCRGVANHQEARPAAARLNLALDMSGTVTNT